MAVDEPATERHHGNWECSRQVDGGFVNLEDEEEYNKENEEDLTKFEFGAIRNQTQCTLDQQKYFKNGKSIYSFTSGKCCRSTTCWDHQFNDLTPVYVHHMVMLVFLF